MRTMSWGVFLAISLALAYSFHADKHLSADGVHVFTLVLEGGGFTAIAWSRQFAHYVTEWPLVLATGLGISDVSILTKVFASGLYLPYLISFGLCLYAVRDENKALLVFPLASMVALNLPSDYLLAGEHQVMATFAWPILLILLRRDDLTWGDGLLLWALLLLFSRLYETAIAPLLVFSAICLVRLRHHRQPEQMLLAGGALLGCLWAVAVSLSFIVNPRHPDNKTSFVREITTALENPEALSAAAFMSIYTIGVFLKNRLVVVSAGLPVIVYVLARVFGDVDVTASKSFASRTLTLTVLPGLLVGAILVGYARRELDRVGRWTFVAFVLVMVAANVHNTRSWNDFRHQVTRLVNTHRGYLPIEETPLQNSPHRWSWNNAELGLVWSASCVHAILLNPGGLPWEPFDPRTMLVLKRYVRYDAAFRSVDRDITTCQR